MTSSPLPLRRIILFTVVVVIIALAVIFMLEDPSSEFSYPIH